jgi:hypothetical protein
MARMISHDMEGETAVEPIIYGGHLPLRKPE